MAASRDTIEHSVVTTRTEHRRDQDLVYDIGLNNGDDSAYYLHLGYRVVGVDADPLLTAQCSRRFQKEIGQGRMKVINAGVLKEPGTFTFHRNRLEKGWSSFEPEKGKKGGQWEQLRVPCVTTQQLILEYGQPLFMKVDIEGADIQALQSLTPDIVPAYLSLELNHVDPIVETLIELGYSGFKFVNCETYLGSTPIFDHQIGWRLLRKTGRVLPFVRSAMRMLPQRVRAKSEFDPPGKYNPQDYPFTNYNSGPFGEDAAGSWLKPRDAARWFETLKDDYCRAGHEESLWWDVHARHASVIRP